VTEVWSDVVAALVQGSPETLERLLAETDGADGGRRA